MTLLVCSCVCAVGCGGDDDEVAAGADADIADVADAAPPDAPLAFGTITGYVQLGSPGEGGDDPANGARISVMGAFDPIVTTADADGNFSFEVPTGVKHLLFEGSPSHFGQVLAVDLTEAGFHFDEVHLVHDDDVAEVATEVGFTAERTKGMVLFDISSASDAGGESATITADSGPPFVFFNEEQPFTQGNTLPGGGGGIVYPNVAPGTTGVAVTGAPGVTVCEVEFDDSWPVVAHAMTFVTATCTLR